MYNKIFTKILDSSVWLEPTPTRIVWITLIAAMDENGFCPFAAVGNVASRARVSEPEARKAIEVLEGPDAESSDQDNDGRRIERVPGGWIVLNAPKYRALVTRVNIQEKVKERVRRFREKKRKSNAPVTACNADETPSGAVLRAETEPEAEGKPLPPPLKKELSDAGSELMAANWLLEELCIPADNGVRKVAAESIRMLAKEGGTIEGATRYIFEAGRQAIADGETITRFWFSDQKYKPQAPVKSKRAKQQEAVWKEFHERNKDDDED